MSWCGLSSLLLLLVLVVFGVGAEWVEIPQFSDQQKVYRMPPASRPYHRVTQHTNNRRVYVADDRFGQQGGFHQEPSLRNITRFSGNRHTIYSEEKRPLAGTISTFTTERILGSASAEFENSDSDEGIMVQSVEDDEPEFEEVPVLYSSVEDVTTTFNANTAVTTTTTSTTTTTVPPKLMKSQPNRNQTEKDDKGFFDYLPIDLLKRVHKTLKSQPATLKGKIRFLKAFERTLIEEIQNKLSTALAPTRKTRGARGHGHDSHDDGIGFPSLEGTLMAISFLTFAVYLVRLVMLLFRNATLTGTPPIFIGRKKRSIDEYSEQAAKILSYLDSSSEEYYKSQKHFSHLNSHSF